jgi:hypothetical protein
MDPDLTQALETQQRDTMVKINCCQIGTVKAVHTAGKQTVDVLLNIQRVVDEKPDGTRTLQQIPNLLEVPFVIMSGGGGFLTFPIAAGDECLVLFNDREIDNWFVNGGMQAPTSRRLHDMSDAFAIVGIRSMVTALAGYLANGVRLALNSTNHIDITPDHVDIYSPNIGLHGTVTVTDAGGSFVVNTHVHKNGGGVGNSGTPVGETP